MMSVGQENRFVGKELANLLLYDTTVSVEDPLGCSGTGGKNSDRHVNIHVMIVEQGTASGVPGATVAVQVNLGGSPFWNDSGITNENGEVVFSLKNADTGTYTTTIDNVSSSGIVWDNLQPADNACTKDGTGIS